MYSDEFESWWKYQDLRGSDDVLACIKTQQWQAWDARKDVKAMATELVIASETIATLSTQIGEYVKERDILRKQVHVLREAMKSIVGESINAEYKAEEALKATEPKP